MRSDEEIAEVTGLVIRSPWIEKILSGEKTWEVRSSRVNMRGPIALIKSKTGSIFGTCRIVDCIGPLSLTQMLANEEKHRVSETMLSTYCRPGQSYAWVLADASPFPQPIPYRHPAGAVIWVRLSEENVTRCFDEVVGAITKLK